jgi:hypothetical protein
LEIHNSWNIAGRLEWPISQYTTQSCFSPASYQLEEIDSPDGTVLSAIEIQAERKQTFGFV